MKWLDNLMGVVIIVCIVLAGVIILEYHTWRKNISERPICDCTSCDNIETYKQHHEDNGESTRTESSP